MRIWYLSETPPPFVPAAASFSSGKHKDGAPLALNTWYPCAPPWTYSNLQSGVYSFVVRAVDNAGNVGLSTTPALIFTVDATLVINGTGASSGGEIGGVSIVLVAILAGAERGWCWWVIGLVQVRNGSGAGVERVWCRWVTGVDAIKVHGTRGRSHTGMDDWGFKFHSLHPTQAWEVC